MLQDALAMGPFVPSMDDDDHDHDDANTSLKASKVDSAKSDRLNPEVEYEVLDLSASDAGALKTKLNEMGKDGWQLLATTPNFIFRRMVKPQDEKLKARVGFGF